MPNSSRNRNLIVYKCKLETFSYTDRDNIGTTQQQCNIYIEKTCSFSNILLCTICSIQWVFLSLILSQVCHSIELSCFFCHFNGIVFPTISIPHFQSNLQFIFLHLCNQYIYISRDLILENMKLCHVAFFEVLFIQSSKSKFFAFISKYQFIKLAYRVNAYINYLQLCINYLYQMNLYDYFYKPYIRDNFQFK